MSIPDDQSKSVKRYWILSETEPCAFVEFWTQLIPPCARHQIALSDAEATFQERAAANFGRFHNGFFTGREIHISETSS